jgi:hypothetical protein
MTFSLNILSNPIRQSVQKLKNLKPVLYTQQLILNSEHKFQFTFNRHHHSTIMRDRKLFTPDFFFRQVSVIIKI